MKKVIHRFVMPSDRNSFELYLPKHALIIFVGMKGEESCIWTIVEPGFKETTRRKFRSIATGEPFDNVKLSYVGTYQYNWETWHLFEEIEKVG